MCKCETQGGEKDRDKAEERMADFVKGSERKADRESQIQWILWEEKVQGILHLLPS